MADTVVSTKLIDGPKTAVFHVTCVSDGSNTPTTVVDASALTPAATKPKIMQLWYDTSGQDVDIFFDATANTLAWTISSTNSGHLDFRCFGGIQNNAGAGVTGDIIFTPRNGTTNDTYSIVIEVSKT